MKRESLLDKRSDHNPWGKNSKEIFPIPTIIPKYKPHGARKNMSSHSISLVSHITILPPLLPVRHVGMVAWRRGWRGERAFHFDVSRRSSPLSSSLMFGFSCNSVLTTLASTGCVCGKTVQTNGATSVKAAKYFC
jgi:hypothetical protein